MSPALQTRIPGPAQRPAFGVVAPFDMELDAELMRWVPAGIDMLMTRTPFVDDVVTVEFAREVAGTEPISVGTRSVTAGRAEVVAYACTSGSFVRGRAGEEALVQTMRESGARQAVTTSGAVVEALHALGVTRVSVATPYVPTLSHLLDTFLEEHGVTVVGHTALGIDQKIWEVEYEQTADLIRQANVADAEAVVVSCTNLPSYDLIAPLEAELGKPIISANQATMWATLRRMNLRAVGLGQALIEQTA